MYTYVLQSDYNTREVVRRWYEKDISSQEKLTITMPGSNSKRIGILDMNDDIMLVYNRSTL